MTAFIMGTVLGAALGMIVMGLLQGVGDFERFYDEDDEKKDI